MVMNKVSGIARATTALKAFNIAGLSLMLGAGMHKVMGPQSAAAPAQASRMSFGRPSPSALAKAEDPKQDRLPQFAQETLRDAVASYTRTQAGAPDTRPAHIHTEPKLSAAELGSGSALQQLKLASALSVAGSKLSTAESASAKETRAFEQDSAGAVGGITGSAVVSPSSPQDPVVGQAGESSVRPAPSLGKTVNLTPYQEELEKAQKKIDDAKKLWTAGLAAVILGAFLLLLGFAKSQKGKELLQKADALDAKAAGLKAQVAALQAQVAVNPAAGAQLAQAQAQLAETEALAKSTRAEGTAELNAGTALLAAGAASLALGVMLMVYAQYKIDEANKEAEKIRRKMQLEQARIINDTANNALR